MQGSLPQLQTAGKIHTNTWPNSQHLTTPQNLGLGSVRSVRNRGIWFGSVQTQIQPKMANLRVYQVGNFGATFPTIRTDI